MLTVQPNLNQGTKQSFGKIYGAQEVITLLEKRGDKIRPVRLKEILPQAKEITDGLIDVWIGQFPNVYNNGIHVRACREIKPGNPLYGCIDPLLKSDSEINDFMRKHLSMLHIKPIDPKIGFSPIFYNLETPNDFGLKILEEIARCKELFLDLTKPNRNQSQLSAIPSHQPSQSHQQGVFSYGPKVDLVC